MSLVYGILVNMVVYFEVDGNIFICLCNVNLIEVLCVVCDVYGFDFVVKFYGY